MDARARTNEATKRKIIARAEHISIQAEPDPHVDYKQPHRITRLSYTFASSQRGRFTELALLEGRHLSVRNIRPRSEPLKYQFDLRFSAPQPVRVRRVAWTWLVVMLGLTVMGGGAIAGKWSFGASWTRFDIVAGALALCGAAGTLLLFLRRTTESLEFRSAHGGATLVSVTSGVGGARAAKQFFVKVIKDINAAKLECTQSKQELLRDEMREHHRLRELGVLSEQEYEISKARILAAH